MHLLKQTGAAANDGSPGGNGWRWFRFVQKESEEREREIEGKRERESEKAGRWIRWDETRAHMQREKERGRESTLVSECLCACTYRLGERK